MANKFLLQKSVEIVFSQMKMVFKMWNLKLKKREKEREREI